MQQYRAKSSYNIQPQRKFDGGIINGKEQANGSTFMHAWYIPSMNHPASEEM